MLNTNTLSKGQRCWQSFCWARRTKQSSMRKAKLSKYRYVPLSWLLGLRRVRKKNRHFWKQFVSSEQSCLQEIQWIMFNSLFLSLIYHSSSLQQVKVSNDFKTRLQIGNLEGNGGCWIEWQVHCCKYRQVTVIICPTIFLVDERWGSQVPLVYVPVVNAHGVMRRAVPSIYV